MAERRGRACVRLRPVRAARPQDRRSPANKTAALARAFAATAAKDAESSLQVDRPPQARPPRHFDVSFARWRADERIFVTTIWRDVTERMAAEEALRDSEGRHRALLEALPQLVWTCGPDGDCDYFNPQWQAYTGAPAERASWLGMAQGGP